MLLTEPCIGLDSAGAAILEKGMISRKVTLAWFHQGVRVTLPVSLCCFGDPRLLYVYSVEWTVGRKTMDCKGVNVTVRAVDHFCLSCFSPYSALWFH